MSAKQQPYRPPRRVGSVQQTFVRLQGISGDVLCVGAPGGPTSYVGVLEVGGISYDLKSQREQERLNDLWQHLLAGITFPVQVLWRSLPLRLDSYLERFERPDPPDGAQPGVWQTLAQAHVQHVRALAGRRTMLQRHVYLLTRVSHEEQARSNVKRLFWPGPPRQSAPEALEQARSELAVRLSELGHRLELLQLSWRRLSGLAELGTFSQSCLSPGTAAQYPLAAETLEAVDRPPQVTRSAEVVMVSVCSSCQATLPEGATLCGDCGTPLHERHEGGTLLPLRAAAPIQVLSDALQDQPTPAGKHRRGPPPAPPARQTLFGQVADLLAPSAIEVSPEHLKVGEEWQQVLVITGLPRTIEAGWLRPLLELDEPFELSFQLRPQDAARMEDLLRRKRTQFQASRMLAQGKGQLVDPHLELAQGDIDDLILHVASGAERLYDLVWLVRVWGATRKELTERVGRLQQVLHLLRLTWRVATYEQGPALRSCLPQVRAQVEGEGLLLPSETISTAFPFVATSLFHPQGVLVGVTPARELIVLDPWEAANANMVVFGPSGQGKSTFIKTLAARLALGYQLRQPDELGFQLFVIDPDSEYGLQAAALGGQKVRLSPGSPDCINPFDLPRRRTDRVTGEGEQVDVLAEHVSHLRRLLAILIAEQGDHGEPGVFTRAETSLLDLALFATYAAVGITREVSTHERSAPLLADLVRVLADAQRWGASGKDLAERLKLYTEGSESGLFKGPTTLDVQRPLVVFDTHACQSDLQQIIAQFLISTFVWGQAFGGDLPRFLVVDEAATWMHYSGGKQTLEEYVQRARKHYLSVITITQHPATFADATLIDNSATKVLLRPDPASLDLVRRLFDLSEREGQRLLRLQVGEALLLVGQQRVLVKNELSELELVLAQTNPRRLAAWLRQPEYMHLRQLLQGLADGGLGNLASYLQGEEASA